MSKRPRDLDHLKSLSEHGLNGWPWTEEVNPSIYREHASWPLISIIMPSLNQGEYIEQAIRSVLMQNYPRLEFILMDGGSTDNSVDIIKYYSHYFKHWESVKDNGQSHAINKGIAIASGDIIQWVNSDDFLEKEALYNIGLQFKDSDVLACRYRFQYEDNRKKNDVIRTAKSSSIERYLAYTLNSQPGTFFSGRVMKQLYPLAEKLHYTMDQDLWIRFLLKFGINKIRFCDQIVSNFRIHSSSKTSKYNSLFLQERNTIFYRMAEEVNESENVMNAIKMISNFELTSSYQANFGSEKSEQISSSLQLYLLGQADKAYSFGNYQLANQLIKAISKDKLDKEGTVLYRKLKLRLPFRSLFVVKK